MVVASPTPDTDAAITPLYYLICNSNNGIDIAINAADILRQRHTPSAVYTVA